MRCKAPLRTVRMALRERGTIYMRSARRLQVVCAACAGMLLAGTLVAVGPGVAEEAGGPAADDEAAGQVQASSEGYTYLDMPNAQSGTPLKAKAYSAEGPIVTELPDGRLVQRTPSEDITSSYDAEGAYAHPSKNVLYNSAYLKADERGCNACHDDLAALLDNCGYGHSTLTNDMGIDITVQMCVDCHTVGDGYQTTFYDFGTMIHGIHQDNPDATCNSCHNMTADGEGVTLWDVTKHSVMRGITPVENVEGTFSWNQTDVITEDQLFNFNWSYLGGDFLRNERQANGDARDTSIYEDWTITLSGEVNQEVTFTLADLIESAPVETKAVTMHCTYNPTGGPYIGNCVVTGIPLSWLIEQAGGLTDAAYGLYSCSSDGNANSMLVENLEGKDALVVYEIDGEPLQWKDGFPCMLWVGGTGAPINCKELSDLVFVGEDDPDLWEYLGWTTEDGEGYYNKPNVGIWGTPEGLCIQAGEAYTFAGYASAWDQPITAVEFSMDGGQTWTTCETPESDVNRWVSWQFEWTPPEGADTAYVLMVRSVAADGSTTPEPLEVMVNAKSDLAAFTEQVHAAQGTDESLAENQAVVDGNVGTNEGGPLEVLDDPAGYAAALSETEDSGWTPDFDLLTGSAVVDGDVAADGDAAADDGDAQ